MRQSRHFVTHDAGTKHCKKIPFQLFGVEIRQIFTKRITAEHTPIRANMYLRYLGFAVLMA
ncbi:MAG: hypothetical protein EB829_06660 [Nitrosopumilus sp. H8]|nr:MAG: hypothetical protein EB829_06660 [Nitrosopumilus sp. H8]RNJ78335.1 MAG: hypothetical protein EB830_00280 [Nitrosopumilus sp. H13]